MRVKYGYFALNQRAEKVETVLCTVKSHLKKNTLTINELGFWTFHSTTNQPLIFKLIFLVVLLSLFVESQSYTFHSSGPESIVHVANLMKELALGHVVWEDFGVLLPIVIQAMPHNHLSRAGRNFEVAIGWISQGNKQLSVWNPIIKLMVLSNVKLCGLEKCYGESCCLYLHDGSIFLSVGHECGSLSPQHGASSGCGWRNGLQYGG